MAAVVHVNPGLMEVSSFLTFGVNAKPNTDSPIGFFGTGLKYAMAVLLRNGINIRLLIGKTEYVFYTTKEEFRGKTFHQCRMKKKGLAGKWSYHVLPFTTELGKTWELWQAYRELHSNALDEGGDTVLATEGPFAQDATSIWIDDSRYLEVHRARAEIFLPASKLAKVIQQDDYVQALEGGSSFVYFRGLRIMKLAHPSIYTYNFLNDVTLTEDRTAKYPQLLEARLAAMIVQSEDTAFLRRVVAQPATTSYEGKMSYSSAYLYRSSSPSPAFMAVAKEAPNPTAKQIWSGEQPTVPTVTRLQVTVPMPSISPAALEAFKEVVASIWQEATVEIPSTQLWAAPDDVPIF